MIKPEKIVTTPYGTPIRHQIRLIFKEGEGVMQASTAHAAGSHCDQPGEELNRLHRNTVFFPCGLCCRGLREDFTISQRDLPTDQNGRPRLVYRTEFGTHYHFRNRCVGLWRTPEAPKEGAPYIMAAHTCQSCNWLEAHQQTVPPPPFQDAESETEEEGV